MRAVLLAFAAAFLLLVARVLHLQLTQQDFLQGQGEARFRRSQVLPAQRGSITDRHGEPLALSAPVASIWANPAGMPPVGAGRLRELAGLLDLSPAVLSVRLRDRSKSFIYLKRQISPDVADRVMALGIPGIARQDSYRRYYPAGEVMAHLVGIAGLDGRGQEGIELAHEDRLAGVPGRRVVLQDRMGRIVDEAGRVVPPKDGQPVALSIDYRIQYLAWREIRDAVLDNRAASGSVVVLDARTGEVLAMASYPSYNPNNLERVAPAQMRNRALVDLFETGSTMKPFAIALALDEGACTPSSVLDTRSYRIGPASVRDVVPADRLDLAGIVHKSSNVGTSKLALRIAPERFWQHYAALGFGQPPLTDFPGEATGRLRHWQGWRPIEQATMSFGYGVSVNLLQMARAYTVFVNEGVLLPVSLYRRPAPVAGQRVLSARAARILRDLLATNTRAGGGATGGRIHGYTSGAKSGTARKLMDGQYVADRHRAMFMGFAPATRPGIVVAVMIDEPSAGRYYGAAVAAPVFARVGSGALRLLNVPPDAPGTPPLPAPATSRAEDPDAICLVRSCR